jgi:hypothetical protein
VTDELRDPGDPMYDPSRLHRRWMSGRIGKVRGSKVGDRGYGKVRELVAIVRLAFETMAWW